MNMFAIAFAIVAMNPCYRVAPVPCESENLAFDIAKWEKSPSDSRWVESLGDKWDTAGYKVTKEFTRSWRWYFRRTTLRFVGVRSNFRVTVNGRAVGESKGEHAVVEFDLSEHLKWFGANTLEFSLTPSASGAVFREALLVSLHPRAPRELKVEGSVADDLRSADFRVLDENDAVIKERHVDNPPLWSDELPVVFMTPVEFSWGWWIFGGTEYRALKFGMKKVEVKDGKVVLNGRPLKIKALGPHKRTPGCGKTAIDFRTMVQDTMFIKGVNANAVFASDYPKDPDLYEIFDRDGVFILARPDETVPPDRPSVLVLPPEAMPAPIAVGDDRKEQNLLKTGLSPVVIGEFDWKNGTLPVRNDYTFIDFDRIDGWSWTQSGADGKTVSSQKVQPLKLAPGASTVLKIAEPKGVKLRVDFFRDDDLVVSRVFQKGN